MKERCSIAGDQNGTALIEAAVLLPMLFVLIFGVFEFSWLICQRHLILQGVRDAARYIAQSGDPNNGLVREGAKRLAATGDAEGGQLRVKGWSPEDVAVTYSSITNSAGANGTTGFRGGAVIQEVTVSTTLTLPSLGFFSIIGLEPPKLTIADTERIVGSD